MDTVNPVVLAFMGGPRATPTRVAVWDPAGTAEKTLMTAKLGCMLMLAGNPCTFGEPLDMKPVGKFIVTVSPTRS